MEGGLKFGLVGKLKGRAAERIGMGRVTASFAVGRPVLSEKHGHTIGLVLTGGRHVLYETPGGKTECPGGFEPTDWDQQRAMGNASELLRIYGNDQSRGPYVRRSQDMVEHA